MFIKVDFPEPEGPIKATYSPRCTSKSTDLSTFMVSVPSLKLRTNLRMSITVSKGVVFRVSNVREFDLFSYAKVRLP